MRISMAAVFTATWLLTAALPASAEWRRWSRCASGNCSSPVQSSACSGGACESSIPFRGSCSSGNCGSPVISSGCSSGNCGSSVIVQGSPCGGGGCSSSVIVRGSPCSSGQCSSSVGTHGSSNCAGGNCVSPAIPGEPIVPESYLSPGGRPLADGTSLTSAEKSAWAPVPAGNPTRFMYPSVEGQELENLLLNPEKDAVAVRVPSSGPRGTFMRVHINAEGKACVEKGNVCQELDANEPMQARSIEELKKWILAQSGLAEKEPYATFVGNAVKTEKPETTVTPETQKEVVANPAPTQGAPTEVATSKPSEVAPKAALSEETAAAVKGLHSMNQRAGAVEQALSQVTTPKAPVAALASALFPKTTALLRPVASFFKPVAEAVKTEAATRAKAIEEGLPNQADEDAIAAIEKMQTAEMAKLPKRAQDAAKSLVEKLEKGKPSQLLASLENLLVNNELYTEKEQDDVFGSKEKYAAIGDKAGVATSYTQARKLLRQTYLDAVAAELRKSSDVRVTALADVVERTKAASAEAYDFAVTRIHDEKRDKPICFSCGEHKTDDYDFHDKMDEAAKAALLKYGFSDGTTKSAWYDGDGYGRTSSGDVVLVGLLDNGQPLLHRNPQTAGIQDPALTEEMKKYFRGELAQHGNQRPAHWTEGQHRAVTHLLKDTWKNPNSMPTPVRPRVAPQAPQTNPVAAAQPRVAQVAQPVRPVEPTASQSVAKLVIVGNLQSCGNCIDFNSELHRLPPGMRVENIDARLSSTPKALKSGNWPIVWLVKNNQMTRLASGSRAVSMIRSGQLANEIQRHR